MKRLILFSLIYTLFGLTGVAQDALSANQLVEEVLSNEFGIIIAEKEQTIAENNDSWGEAGAYPRLSLQGGGVYSLNNTQLDFFSGEQRNISNAEEMSYNAGLRVDYTLFNGRSMYYRKEQFANQAQQAGFQKRLEIDAAVSDALEFYYNLVQQIRYKSYLEDQLELSKERRTLARRKREIGTMGYDEVLQAEIDYENDSVLFMNQELEIKKLTSQVNRLRTTPPETTINPTDSIKVEELPPYQELKGMLSEHADIKLQSMRVKEATLNQHLSRAGLMPQVDAYGSYNYRNLRSEAGILARNIAHGPEVGFQASFNLFDGNKTRRSITNAMIQEGIAENQLEMTKTDREQMLYALYQEYQNAVQVMNVRKSNLKKVKKNVEIAYEKYRTGVLNGLDFRTIQMQENESRISMLEAQYTAKRTELLIKELCGLLEF